MNTESRRWLILAVGTFAQAATCCFLYGIPMLVPALRESGMGLVAAGVVVSAPTFGLLFTLIVWGALADRYGERIVIAVGVAGATAALVAAALVHNTAALIVLLGLAGASGASVNAASGRVVMGWFSAHHRGLAMGIRQTAQPLGVAIAALALPPLARGHGAYHALLFPAVLCAVAAAATWLLVSDPPRPPRTGATGLPIASPYRGSRTLPRLHLSSAMLVFPQFTVSAFTVIYLVDQRDWDAAAAGRFVFVLQVLGALARVGSGVWSDRVGSRLRPMRQLAFAAAACMALLALGAVWHSWVVLVAFALGAVITVSDNGLAYTAVAELAGGAWAGRALGTQNTVQNVAAVITPPLFAAVIGQDRYAWAFALAVLPPLIAIVLTPVRDEAGHTPRTRARAETARVE
jgi:MFS family permease